MQLGFSRVAMGYNRIDCLSSNYSLSYTVLVIVQLHLALCRTLNALMVMIIIHLHRDNSGSIIMCTKLADNNLNIFQICNGLHIELYHVLSRSICYLQGSAQQSNLKIHAHCKGWMKHNLLFASYHRIIKISLDCSVLGFM